MSRWFPDSLVLCPIYGQMVSCRMKPEAAIMGFDALGETGKLLI